MNFFLFCGYRYTTCSAGVYFPCSHTSYTQWHCSWWLIGAPGFKCSFCFVSVFGFSLSDRKQCYNWARMIQGGQSFGLDSILALHLVYYTEKQNQLRGKAEFCCAFLSVRGEWHANTLVFLCTYPSDCIRSSLSADNGGFVSWPPINTGLIPHWNRAEWYSQLLSIAWRLRRRPRPLNDCCSNIYQ